MNEFVLLALVVTGSVFSIIVLFDFDEKLAVQEDERVGRLIVVEGIEGSGKSELLDLMKDVMPSNWAYTKEPYYFSSNTPKKRWTKENYQLDRECHVQDKILPLLEQHKVIITNRYWMSGCVYDGWDSEAFMTYWPEPDLIIWLDCEPDEEHSQRVGVPLDELKARSVSYKQFFSKLRKETLLPVKTVNSTNLNSEDVLEQIMSVLEPLSNVPIEQKQTNDTPIAA
ncbi:MAG TPA: hypothetical protein V6C96_01490 [Vampirovibrionales bacterium]